MVDGWANFHRLIRPDLVAGLNHMFQDGALATAVTRDMADLRNSDRHARAAGKAAAAIPVVDADATKPSALPTPDSFEFFSTWAGKSNWKNEVTVKS